MAENNSLNWLTFTDHLQLMFKDLYEEGKHSDVILVCDDQIQFKAHKILLRTCSPVFKKIIDGNFNQNPLIYLRGIHSHEMESILQFMYLGEGRFYYERMGEFIKVAKDLEVKEISKGMEIANEEKDAPEESIIDDKEKGFDEYHEPKQLTTIKQMSSYAQIRGPSPGTARSRFAATSRWSSVSLSQPRIVLNSTTSQPLVKAARAEARPILER